MKDISAVLIFILFLMRSTWRLAANYRNRSDFSLDERTMDSLSSSEYRWDISNRSSASSSTDPSSYKIRNVSADRN